MIKLKTIIVIVSVIVLFLNCTSNVKKEDTTLLDREFIDIPEMITDRLWFEDKSITDKYYEAMRRFRDSVDLVDGYFEVNLRNGKEIGISEELFNIFYEGLLYQNNEVREGKYTIIKHGERFFTTVRPERADTTGKK